MPTLRMGRGRRGGPAPVEPTGPPVRGTVPRRASREPPAAPPPARRGVPEAAPEAAVLAEPPAGELTLRILLTLIGAAGMIFGPFLAWLQPERFLGTELGLSVYYRTPPETEASFFQSAGFAMIAVGFAAIIGLSLRSGWMTRIAGALGAIGFVLYAITLERSGFSFTSSIGVGAWIAFAGSIFTLVGGFFGSRGRIIMLSERRRAA